jgi:hypothetical protein
MHAGRFSRTRGCAAPPDVGAIDRAGVTPPHSGLNLCNPRNPRMIVRFFSAAFAISAVPS